MSPGTFRRLLHLLTPAYNPSYPVAYELALLWGTAIPEAIDQGLLELGVRALTPVFES